MKHLNLTTKFNSINVDQTRDHIKLHAKSCIQHLLESHHWDAPSKHESQSGPLLIELFSPSVVEKLHGTKGHQERTLALSQLEQESQLKCCTLVGKLFFACVMCRCNIIHMIVTLSKCTHCPAKCHCDVLKHVAICLRHAHDWGVVCWHPYPLLDLPL